jgi:RNA polymerase sigma-70 factor (ECF subfamily)
VETIEDGLLHGLRRGEPRAYETVVRAHGPRMLSVARGCMDTPEEAEDVVQSAVLLLARFAHRLAAPSDLSASLHRVVVDCALMRLQRRRRPPDARLNVSAFEDASLAALAPSLAPEASRDRLRRPPRDGLLRAPGRLSDLFRAAVRLRDLDGLTLAEVGRLEGRALAGTRTSVQRGRIALRTLLAGGEGPSHAFPRGSGLAHRDGVALPPPCSHALRDLAPAADASPAGRGEARTDPRTASNLFPAEASPPSPSIVTERAPGLPEPRWASPLGSP